MSTKLLTRSPRPLQFYNPILIRQTTSHHNRSTIPTHKHTMSSQGTKVSTSHATEGRRRRRARSNDTRSIISQTASCILDEGYKVSN